MNRSATTVYDQNTERNPQALHSPEQIEGPPYQAAHKELEKQLDKATGGPTNLKTAAASLITNNTKVHKESNAIAALGLVRLIQ